MAATATQSVIDIRKVCMAFAKPSGESLPVLADIDITLAEGEILGVLGRSGQIDIASHRRRAHQTELGGGGRRRVDAGCAEIDPDHRPPPNLER